MPLRPAKADDKRPLVDDPRVRTEAVLRNREALEHWARKRDVPEDEFVEDVVEVYQRALGDLDRCMVMLLHGYGYEVDASLKDHLCAIKKLATPAYRIVLLEWIVRNAIRFPARVGELIAFTQDGESYTAKVVALDIQMMVGFVEVNGNPRHAVLAEEVTYNISRDKHVRKLIEGPQ